MPCCAALSPASLTGRGQRASAWPCHTCYRGWSALDLDAHGPRGARDDLLRGLDRGRVEVRHLDLRDLANLCLGHGPDLGLVRLVAALLYACRLLDQLRGGRGLGDERERAVFVDGDLDGDYVAPLALRCGVVLLDEVHDVDAVRAKRGAHGRRRGGGARVQLHLDDRGDLLLPWRHRRVLPVFPFLVAVAGLVWGRGAGADLADLIEGQLDRSFPAEDRDEHLELLGVGVDLVDRGRQRRERPVHHGNRLADLEVDRRGADRFGLLRGLLGRHRRQQAGDFIQAQRRRAARQTHEAGHTRRVPDRGPRLVRQVHAHQDVARQHLFLDLLALAGFDLHDLMRRHLDLEDVLLHVEGLSPALQVRPHPVLVTGVGVHHVPVTWQHPQLGLERLDRIQLLFFWLGGRLIGLPGAVTRLDAVTQGSAVIQRSGGRLIGRLLLHRRIVRRQFVLRHDSLSPLRFCCALDLTSARPRSYHGTGPACDHAATLRTRGRIQPPDQVKSANTALVKP